MEHKWLAIATIGSFVAIMGATAFDSYFKSQVQIACYEAAKTNHSITCDPVKK